MFDYFKKDELVKNSSVIFIASIMSGAFSYVYQVYMGRVLGPEEYGVFGALFAIFYMIGVIGQTLGTSMTRFVSKFVGEGKDIGFFIRGSLKRMALVGCAVSITFLIFSNGLMALLKMSDYRPVAILILILFLTWIAPVMDGTLRGIKKFPVIGFTSMSNTFCKMTFGILLVMLGFGVTGALMGVAIGMIVGLAISFMFIRKYVKTDGVSGHDFKFSSFYVYSIPVLFAMISYSIPGNLDVILAKHFFSSAEAGIYTSVSVLGKIIFFFPAAVGVVMFPMIAERHARGEDTRKILKKSIGYVTLLSGPLVGVYLLFPGIVVHIFGDRYVDAVGLIGSYGVAMFLFSLSAIIMNYHLAIKNMRYISIFVGFTIVEVILLAVFHSSSAEMIRILFVSSLLLVVMSVVYTFGHKSDSGSYIMNSKDVRDEGDAVACE